MISKKIQPARFIWTASFLCLCVFCAPQTSICQDTPAVRPPTEELLPETTVAFIQIDNIRDYITKVSNSSVGRMFQDEAVAPMVEELWGEAKAAYSEYEGQIGVSLEDLQSFPAGELTFAVIAPRRKDPEFMLIIQTDPESEAVDRILERGRSLVREGGMEIETADNDDGIKFESFQFEGRKIKFFRKDGLLVGSTSEEELDQFIDRWMKREVEKTRPLSENRKFITIMNRCLGTKKLKPEARFFVDPITLAKSATRGNFAAQAGLGFLPILGLDGLLGVGGSMILTEDDFESIAHAHILLANPRAGIFEMLAFKPTDYQPEPWLPSDVSNYFTTSWDVDQMLAELTKMIESFQGEGVVDKFFADNVDKEAGFDVREEVLGGLTGRVTMAQWIEPPMRFNSQVPIFAFELKDPKKFEETLDKIVTRINRDTEEDNEDRVDEMDYKGVRILGPSEERIQNQMERQRERRRERLKELGQEEDAADIPINNPSPSFALVGNYLLISPQSREFVRRAIDTDQGDLESLATSEEYLKVAAIMSRLLKSDMPSGMTYSKPVETFRWMFELAKSEDTKNFVAGQAENNKYVGGIKRVLDNNPLPEFEKLEHYFQPQGGFMTSDDTGLHFLIFQMKSPDEDK